MYIAGMYELLIVDEAEFKEILNKWKKCNAEINELYNNS